MEQIEYNGEVWDVLYWVSGSLAIVVRPGDPYPKRTYCIEVATA